MDAATRTIVRQRAGDRCEYCRLPQSAQPYDRFHVDHVLPKKHGGSDEPSNLCLACRYCNQHKGPNLSGVDPWTDLIERLFDPRNQSWQDYFELRGVLILGLSSVGRTSVIVLSMNARTRLQLRAALIRRGDY